MTVHLSEDTTVERGGFLLGRLSTSRGRDTIKVDRYLPAHRAVGTATRLNIPPEDFFDAHDEMSDDPGVVMVGWAHSHPGLTVFLSQYDHFLWDSYFGHAHQLAIVIDPVAHDGAVFARNKTTGGSQMVAVTEVGESDAASILNWSGYRLR